MQGVVKVYDPETGIGVIRRDDGDEVLLQPGSLEGSLFRMLRQGQRVVFDATDVPVDSAFPGVFTAHPLSFGLSICHDVIADWIDVAQVVPTGAGPLRHRVEIALVRLEAVSQVELDRGPVGGAAEGWLGFGLFVEFTWCPVDQVREVDR